MTEMITLDGVAKDRMLAWVEALESGEYEQARRVLSLSDNVDGPFRHCCLGVLCEVAIANGLTELDRSVVSYMGTGGEYVVAYGATQAYTSAPAEVVSWLFDENVVVDSHILSRLMDQNVLIKLNDDAHYDFYQIAAHLRGMYSLDG